MKTVTAVQIGDKDVPLIINGRLRLAEQGDVLTINTDISLETAYRLLVNDQATPARDGGEGA